MSEPKNVLDRALALKVGGSRAVKEIVDNVTIEPDDTFCEIALKTTGQITVTMPPDPATKGRDYVFVVTVGSSGSPGDGTAKITDGTYQSDAMTTKGDYVILRGLGLGVAELAEQTT